MSILIHEVNFPYSGCRTCVHFTGKSMCRIQAEEVYVSACMHNGIRTVLVRCDKYTGETPTALIDQELWEKHPVKGKEGQLDFG
jgi:hypothetical protein